MTIYFRRLHSHRLLPTYQKLGIKLVITLLFSILHTRHQFRDQDLLERHGQSKAGEMGPVEERHLIPEPSTGHIRVLQDRKEMVP